jgi:hypothetical protein
MVGRHERREGETMGESWRNVISNSFDKFLAKLITFLPDLLAMVTILIVGFLIAWVFKKLLFRFLKAIHFDGLSERWGLTRVLSKGGVPYTPTHLLTRFLYWVIIIITILLGINTLKVTVTQNLITQFFNYLPNFFAAIIILAVGYLVAIFLGQATLIAAVNAQMESAQFLSRAVRWFIAILSLTMALYHLGIAEKVIIATFTILLGGTVLALAIAFGWGGRELARDFLERLYRKKEEKVERKDRMSHL